ncbi:MAG TPA: hypothetical protein VNZ58_06585, partial [Thermomicrobiales bacterium]|nr:hypothetical protein [Thermomicrobiales bacterium]
MSEIPTTNPETAVSIEDPETGVPASAVLTPMERVRLARDTHRPHTLDYIRELFTDFIELHGDRS